MSNVYNFKSNSVNLEQYENTVPNISKDEEKKIVQVYEDELHHLIDLMRNFQSESWMLDHIISGFVIDNNLYRQFEEWLLEQKRIVKQADKNDDYEVITELYGDIEERLKQFEVLLASYDVQKKSQ